MPLLHVDTVVEAIVDTLDSGLSRTIFLPGIFRLFAGLVSRPFKGKGLIVTAANRPSSEGPLIGRRI